MNPTETVRAAVCAYAVEVGTPMRPSPRVIRQSSKRQVAILTFVLSTRRAPDATVGPHAK
jgi:hypothetical protein